MTSSTWPIFKIGLLAFSRCQVDTLCTFKKLALFRPRELQFHFSVAHLSLCVGSHIVYLLCPL